MKSCYIPVRLNPDEAKKLDEMIATNETTGFENRGEFFRLLLWREWNRRKGLGPPRVADWQTSFRIGGKKKEAV